MLEEKEKSPRQPHQQRLAVPPKRTTEHIYVFGKMPKRSKVRVKNRSGQAEHHSRLFVHLFNPLVSQSPHARQSHSTHRPLNRAHSTHMCNRCTLLMHVVWAWSRPRERWLVLHARVLQHIGPFSTCTRVAMLQMLTKMVGTEEFLRLIAFTEFMHVLEVGHPGFPVWSWIVWKFYTTITTNIRRNRVHGW